MSKQQHAFIRLTALWAFVESGLGGMMHALHLPFTGLVLGGFSIIIMSLIAHSGERPAGNILKATLIVLMVKASVNPMTSPMAYVAVSFQALCGALVFSTRRRYLASTVFLGLITMAESAFQKLLIVTVIFGTAWLKALDGFYKSTMKAFGISAEDGFSMLIVYTYVGIYLAWGLVLGIWMYYIPRQLDRRRGLYSDLQPKENLPEAIRKKKKKRGYMLIILAVIVFAYTFFLSGEDPLLETLVLIFRTLTVVALWVYVVLPLWSRFVKRKLEERRNGDMRIVLDFIPRIAAYVQPLYQRVSLKHKGLKRIKEFVLGMVIISLHLDDISLRNTN